MKITFDMGHAYIAGIIKAGYVVKAHQTEDLIGYGPLCWLIIPKTHWKRMWNEWCKMKEDYCERYGHFCGVGHVEVEAVLVGKDTMLDETNIVNNCFQEMEVNVWRFTGDYLIQMEHG